MLEVEKECEARVGSEFDSGEILEMLLIPVCRYGALKSDRLFRNVI